MLPGLAKSCQTVMPQLVFGRRFAASRDCDWHTHEVPELVLVTQGRCTCSAAKAVLAGGPGVLWIMPAHTPQYQRNFTFTRTIYIGVKLGGYRFSQQPRAVAVGLEGYIRRWMDDLIDLQQTARDPQRVTSPLLAALLGELGRIESRQDQVGYYHPALNQAISYLEEHLTQPLRIADLAGYVHLSPSHLTSLFRQNIKVSPLQYQQQLRLRLAERLLSDPHATVKQVAFACGYTDCGYFVRLFRQRYALPPDQWRKNAKRI